MKILSFVICFLTLLNLPLNAQIYSEAPVLLQDGITLSDMVYIKVKPNHFFENNESKNIFDANSIADEYGHIRQAVLNLCKKEMINEDEFKFQKLFPHLNPKDTIHVDHKTNHVNKLPDMSKWYIVEFPKLVDIESIIFSFKMFPEIEYAHGPVQAVNYSVNEPNDYFYENGSQWYLDNIEAPSAWQITKGNSQIKIAIIEANGVPEQTHDDLENKILSGGDTSPENDHATLVAGFAGAETDNEIGVASLSWNTKLLTYTFTGTGSDHQLLADKIDEAVSDSASVINMSFGTVKTGFTNCDGVPEKSADEGKGKEYYYHWDYPVVRQAIARAIGQNVSIVASAGNTSGIIGFGVLPCEDIPFNAYPAMYNGVIGVSASYQNDDFVDIWNYGDDLVDVNAPGHKSPDSAYGLISTYTGNTYVDQFPGTSKPVAGTSFAAPQVASLAGLLKSLDASLTPAQIENILESTADKVGQYPYYNGRNEYFGYGRINAFKAVLEAEHGTWYNAYQNKSYLTVATYSNGSRHLVNGAGYLHEAFTTTDGMIFYRRSDDDGRTWQITKRISGELSDNRSAALLYRNGKIHAVWQRALGSYQYEVYYANTDAKVKVF
jgi:subtilisin family serine protease